jgi:hypothetical protein
MFKAVSEKTSSSPSELHTTPSENA